MEGPPEVRILRATFGDSRPLVTVAKCLKEATEGRVKGLVWAQGFRTLGPQSLVLWGLGP